MKAILEFNIPEEQSDLNDAINGLAYRVALYNIMEHLRYMIEKAPTPTKEVVVYEKIQSVFYDFTNGLSLE